MGTYATPADLREQGLADTISDVQAQRALEAASRTIDRITGFFFELRQAQTYALDGDGTPVLELPAPCITLTSVTVYGQVVDLVALVNRNRPPEVADDFWYPRLEWMGLVTRLERAFGARHTAAWAVGAQNIVVVGDFGFVVDSVAPSGSKVPPPEIQQACIKLAQILLQPVEAGDSGASRLERYLQSEKIGNYSYSYGAAGGGGMEGLTADPEIDAILARYTRSQMGTPGWR